MSVLDRSQNPGPLHRDRARIVFDWRMANDPASDLQSTATSYAASREFLTMPSSPWRSFSQIQPDREYLVQLSYLPLLGYRSLPRFGKWLLAIQRQLGQTDGIIGYSLLAHPLQLNFWTLSAWRDKAALSKFFRSAPHAEAMKALRAHMGQTRFIEWTVTDSTLPPTWNDAMKRFHQQPAIAE